MRWVSSSALPKPLESTIGIDSEDLSIENLSAGYGSVTTLEGFCLTLPKRSVTVIMGPGGSGKSTIVRAICGIREQKFWCRGTIRVPPLGISAQLQTPVGVWTSLAEILSAGSGRPLEVLRTAAAKGLPQVAEILEAELLRPIQEVPVSHVRLAQFVSAIEKPAACYIFDEPDAELRPELITELQSTVKRLREAAAILVITHHLAFAREIADYSALLEDGSVVESDIGSRFFAKPAHKRTRQFLQFGS